jgi:hypothetical protein
LYLASHGPVIERKGVLIMVDDESMTLEPGHSCGVIIDRARRQ